MLRLSLAISLLLSVSAAVAEAPKKKNAAPGAEPAAAGQKSRAEMAALTTATERSAITVVADFETSRRTVSWSSGPSTPRCSRP